MAGRYVAVAMITASWTGLGLAYRDPTQNVAISKCGLRISIRLLNMTKLIIPRQLNTSPSQRTRCTTKLLTGSLRVGFQ